MVFDLKNMLEQGLPASAVEHPVTFWRLGRGKVHLSQFCTPRRRSSLPAFMAPLGDVRARDLCARCGTQLGSAAADLADLVAGCRTLLEAYRVLAGQQPAPLGRAAACENLARKLGWYAARIPAPGFLAEVTRTRTALAAAARQARGSVVMDQTLWADATAGHALLGNAWTSELAAGASMDNHHGHRAIAQALEALVAALRDQQPWPQARDRARGAAAAPLSAHAKATGTDRAPQLEAVLDQARQTLRARHGPSAEGDQWVLIGWAECPNEFGPMYALRVAEPVVDEALGRAWYLIARVPAQVAAPLLRHWGRLEAVPVEAGDTPAVLRTALALKTGLSVDQAFEAARLIHAPAR